MNVPEVLDSLRRRSSRRFPLEVSPRAFPLIAMDRQLLRYIYRNAVSNASKYGGRGGSVETRLQYEHQHQKLVMQVINSPGTGHQELLQLTEEEVNEVFAPDTQLEPTKLAHGSHAQSVRNTSSGNGAWIMQKVRPAAES
jgi:K+-sensing histidine kinase KdpD